MKHLYTFANCTLIVLSLILFTAPASAQTTIARQNVDAYATDPWHTTYALTWLPTDYQKTNDKYPLIIFLHGKGETGNGPSGLWSQTYNGLPQTIGGGWNPEARNPVDGKNYKFIVVSPQANTAANWSLEWSQLKDIIPMILARYRVDESRIYITGLSAGGQGAWSCVTSGPAAAKKFAAIVPVSSANAVPSDSIPLVGGKYGVNLWQICGDQDPFWGFVTNSTKLYNSGNPSNKAIATPMVGVGHWGWNTAYDPNWRSNENKMNIYEWMLQFTNSNGNGGNGNNGNGNGNNATDNTTSQQNTTPTGAYAGTDITITLPANSAQLSATSSGNSVTYKWSQVSGPNKASFSSKHVANPVVTGLIKGSYLFRVSIKNKGAGNNDDNDDAEDDDENDKSNGKTTDDIAVTVNAAPIITPVATWATVPGRVEAENFASMSGVQTESTWDAGGGQNVGWIDQNDWMDFNINPATSGNYTLSLRTATANSNAQLQVRNSAGAVLGSLTLNNTGSFQSWQTQSITLYLTAGKQTLRLISTASPIWNINWLDFALVPNKVPVANAGSNQTITLPVNSVTVTGTATDSDGKIASYAWSQTSGPSTASISSPAQAQTAINNLSQGSYVFLLTAKDDDGASATSSVTITVNPAPVVVVTPPPPPPPVISGPSGRIEAEDYKNMSGIQTESTWDEGGGKNVGWIDNSDWMEYDITTAKAGTYTLSFRIATPNNNAQFDVRKSDGSVLTTVSVPNTSGYQTWKTITATVTLANGTQRIRLVSTNASIWNINWLELGAIANPPAPTTTSRIEAENYTNMSGVQKEVTLDAGGGLDVGWIDNGDWMDYSVNVATAGTYPLSLRIATPNTGSQLQVRKADGSVLSFVAVPNTGGYQNWQTVTVNIALAAGQQTIRLASVASPIWNINWLEIAGAVAPAPPTPVASSTRIEAETYTVMSGVQKEICLDAGGGQDVGWIENGDWMDYSINLPAAGFYTVSFRVATEMNNARVDLKRNDYSSIVSVAVPNTNGFQSWKTVSASGYFGAGPQTVRLQATGSSTFNVNWIEIVPAGNSSQRVATASLAEKAVAANGKPLSFYPNPVQDKFALQIDNDRSGTYTVQVLTVNGNVVKSFQLNKASGKTVSDINIGGLARGAYLVRVVMQDWVQTAQLIKQ